MPAPVSSARSQMGPGVADPGGTPAAAAPACITQRPRWKATSALHRVAVRSASQALQVSDVHVVKTLLEDPTLMQVVALHAAYGCTHAPAAVRNVVRVVTVLACA